MAIAESFLQELEEEARTTERVLERVPDAQLDWRPHPKSYSLGQLALHVAQIPGAVATLAMQPVANAPQFVQERAAASADLVPALRQSVTQAKAALAGASDETMLDTWRLVAGDREIMAIPRASFLRVGHAEPLVSPPRPAARLFAPARRPRAVGIRAKRRREPVRVKPPASFFPAGSGRRRRSTVAARGDGPRHKWRR